MTTISRANQSAGERPRKAASGRTTIGSAAAPAAAAVEEVASNGPATPARQPFMMFLWIVSGASLLVAMVSWNRARRTARRLEELSQMYWEVRYELGELRVEIRRLSGQPEPLEPEPPERATTAAFVPLATLKRR